MHTVDNLLWKGLWTCRLKDGLSDDQDDDDDDDNDQWCKNVI